MSLSDNVFGRDDLRDRARVFRDRGHAGQCLAGMLRDYRGANALVLAIPAGGIPVAASMAAALELPLDVVAVSKMTLPRSTEVGYGAVAFDSSMLLNSPLIRAEGLTEVDIRHGVDETKKKVRRRMLRLRGSLQLPNLAGRHVFLVDDGLASGFTMLTAIESVRRLGRVRHGGCADRPFQRGQGCGPERGPGLLREYPGRCGFLRCGRLRDLARCLRTRGRADPSRVSHGKAGGLSGFRAGSMKLLFLLAVRSIGVHIPRPFTGGR